MRRFILILILALVSGCKHLQTGAVSSVPAGTDSTRDGTPVTREQVMQTAEAFAGHQWRAGEANVFHGDDAKGTRVDTPDVKWCGRGGWYADGRINTGIPYCWGGDNTLSEFDAGIQAGRPAGYHFKTIDRTKTKDPSDSALPVGVDCSGFVSRCWRLKVRKSTYDIIEVSYQLPSLDDLHPGDAVNKPYDHIILFVGWADKKHDKMYVYEAGDSKKDGDPKNYERVHKDVYDRAWLVKRGFVPLRYKQIED
jgi:hypothetical protein